MYTEVKEVVNFLCRYLHGRLPRRPVGIFGAELGNYLISQFASTWDPNNPLNGENERCILINCPEGSSKCFESSADEAGLRLADVLSCFPERYRFFVNPGAVYIMGVKDGIKVPLWMGHSNADENFYPVPAHILAAARNHATHYTSNLGAVGKNIELPPKTPRPPTDLATQELLNGVYVPLMLEKSDAMNSNLSHLHERYPYIFIYKSNSTETYTGRDFSQTRFGSSKPRPDLQTMVNIKNRSSQEETVPSSTSSSSPTFEQQPLATSPYMTF